MENGAEPGSPETPDRTLTTCNRIVAVSLERIRHSVSHGDGRGADRVCRAVRAGTVRG